MATEKNAEQKKLTVILSKEEAEFVQEAARNQSLSVSQFLKATIFPDSFKQVVDSAVYKSIRDCEPLSRSICIKLKLQKRVDVPFREQVYVWLERYNYIFVRDEKSDILYPLCHRLMGRTPIQSILIAIMNCQTHGFHFNFFEFDKIAKHLEVIDHPTYEDCFIVENTIMLHKSQRGYMIVQE